MLHPGTNVFRVPPQAGKCCGTIFLYAWRRCPNARKARRCVFARMPPPNGPEPPEAYNRNI